MSGTPAQPNDGASGPRSTGGFSNDLMVLLTVLIWGINFTAVKVAVTHITPLAFNALRFSLSTLVTFAVLQWQARGVSERKPLRLPLADAGRMIVLGLLGHGLYQVLFANGIARTAPGNASLIMATSPIWIAILGRLLRIERINRLMALGILISFAGITLFVTSGGKVSLDSSTLFGDALILGCAILWAIYTVESKPVLAHYSPLELTAWTMLAGTVLLILVSIPQLIAQDWSAVPPLAWVGLIYSAVLSGALGYVLWSRSVQRVGNARTAVYSNLTPVIAILFAWATLGDRLAPLQMVGGLIVLSGLVVTRRGRAVSVQRRGG